MLDKYSKEIQIIEYFFANIFVCKKEEKKKKDIRATNIFSQSVIEFFLNYNFEKIHIYMNILIFLEKYTHILNHLLDF